MVPCFLATLKGGVEETILLTANLVLKLKPTNYRSLNLLRLLMGDAEKPYSEVLVI